MEIIVGVVLVVAGVVCFYLLVKACLTIIDALCDFNNLK